MADCRVTGPNGCAGKVHRSRGGGWCRQRAIVWRGRHGIGYCYYHDPEKPKKFGESKDGRQY